MAERPLVKNERLAQVISINSGKRIVNICMATLSEFDHGGSNADHCADNGVMKVIDG
jgi:hypothetical protein